MEAMVDIRLTFFEECREELEALERTLPILKGGDPDAETIGTAYRAVHSIKGGAASFKLNGLSAFAKTFESLLGEIRAGRMDCDREVADLVARSAEGLAHHVESAERTAPLADEIAARVALSDPDAEEPPVESEGAIDFAAMGFVPVSVEPDDVIAEAGSARFDILFVPEASLYASANEAGVLIRETLALGEGSVACETGALPPLAELDPEGAHLSFRITLTSEASEADLRDIFSFVEDDCRLEIARAAPGPRSAADDEDPQALLARLMAAARS